MPKKIKGKSKEGRHFNKNVQTKIPVQVSSKKYVPTKKDNFFLYLILFVFAFVLYGNTIFHDYALDDCLMITDNHYTQSGIKGIKDILLFDTCKGYGDNMLNSTTGGRYRPLSLVTFALEKEFFGKNSHVEHFNNILLYAITGIFIFVVLSKLLKKLPRPNLFLSVPFITALLFLAHPLHTEVVANIKSRDEILALLFSLITLYLFINYLESSKKIFLILSMFTFFLALLSKEITVIFILIIPLFIYFFKDIPLKKLVLSALPLFAVTLAFIVLRQSAVGQSSIVAVKSNDFVNNTFAGMNVSQKYATIFYTLGLYVKLIFIPHPLTYDYYPYYIPIMNWSDFGVIFSILIYLFLLFIAFKGLANKKYISFCILLYLIPFSLISNILFPVGVFMGERLMYTSSLGFSMLIAYFLVVQFLKKFKVSTLIPLIILLPVLGLYSFKTIDRNKAWKDDFTLYETDVKTSINSTHSTHSYGKALFVKAEVLKDKAEQARMIDTAIVYLDKSFHINPNDQNVNYLLGKIYGKYKNDLNKSIYYLNNAANLNPDHFESANDLGIVYAMSGQSGKAIEIWEKTLKKTPQDADLLNNLSIAYNSLGNTQKSQEYLAKAKLAKSKKK